MKQKPDIFCALAVDAAYVMLQAEGVEGLSMRKLASKLNCSTQKLYSNFKNKDALLLAIATHLRERIRIQDLSVKQGQDPLHYLLDLTLTTLHFFKSEPAALEVLMQQRYRLSAIDTDDINDPYYLALKKLNCSRLSTPKTLSDALSSIRLLLVGATYSLQGASAIQSKSIFKATQIALCSMLCGWGMLRD